MLFYREQSKFDFSIFLQLVFLLLSGPVNQYNLLQPMQCAYSGMYWFGKCFPCVPGSQRSCQVREMLVTSFGDSRETEHSHTLTDQGYN